MQQAHEPAISTIDLVDCVWVLCMGGWVDRGGAGMQLCSRQDEAINYLVETSFSQNRYWLQQESCFNIRTFLLFRMTIPLPHLSVVLPTFLYAYEYP